MLCDLTSLLSLYGLEGKLFVWRDLQNKKVAVAQKLLENHLQEGRLRPGQTVVEASAGSMAAAVSSWAEKHGHGCVVFTFEAARPRLCPGTELRTVKPETGEFPLEAFQRCARQHAAGTGAFYLNQFEDDYHLECYRELGRQICGELTIPPDFYIDKAGTGATFRGIAEAFRECWKNIKCYCLQNPAFDKILFLKNFDFEVLHNPVDAKNFPISLLKKRLRELFGIVRVQEGIYNVAAALKLLREKPGSVIFTTIGD